MTTEVSRYFRKVDIIIVHVNVVTIPAVFMHVILTLFSFDIFCIIIVNIVTVRLNKNSLRNSSSFTTD